MVLLPGTHYLPATLVLTEEDSGTQWRGSSRGEAVVSGGLRLDLAWIPYRDGIWQAPVPPGLAMDPLFVDGERQQLARYPDFDPRVRHFSGYAADAFSPERARRWADPTGAYLHAMHRHDWGDFPYRVTGKAPDGTLRFEGGWQNNRPRHLPDGRERLRGAGRAR